MSSLKGEKITEGLWVAMEGTGRRERVPGELRFPWGPRDPIGDLRGKNYFCNDLKT